MEGNWYEQPHPVQTRGARESRAPARREKLRRYAFLHRSKSSPAIPGRAFAARVIVAHPLDVFPFPPRPP